jgi:hypothetical protein
MQLFFFGITLGHAVSHAFDKLSFKRMLILFCIFMWEVPSSNFSLVTNCPILKIAQNKIKGCDANVVYSIRKIIAVFSLWLLQWSGQCSCIFQMRILWLFTSVPSWKCGHGNFTPFYTFCNSPFIIILSLLMQCYIATAVDSIIK